MLEGKYFLTFSKEDKLEWQGEILKQIGEDHYIVQLFDWGAQKGSQRFVNISKMETWWFYDSEEDMIAGFENMPEKLKG